MKNLKDFKGFILESYSSTEREDLFIGSYSEGEVFEAKKRFSIPELAKEARTSLKDGEVIQVELPGSGKSTYMKDKEESKVKKFRPMRTITPEFGRQLLDMIDSIAYGEFRRRWTTLSEEQFDEVKFRAIKYILMDWDKSVDKPGLTDDQIYGNLRTLIKSRMMAAHRQYMGEIVNQPVLLRGEDPDILDRTISKITSVPSSVLGSDLGKGIEMVSDLKIHVGDKALRKVQELPLEIRKEVYRLLSRNPRYTFEQIKKSLGSIDAKDELRMDTFTALKKIFQLTKA
jgi:hypothetical protein